MSDLKQLMEFVKFTHQIRNVKRAVVLENDIHENDAEHMYQAALTALFIIDANNLDLDKFKCMALMLVHDIVEAYAGDISVFAPSKDIQAKLQAEEQAIKQFKKDWPTNKTLHSLIYEYETRQTPEAKFAYALDKLMPEINNYLYDGKAWRQQGVTLDKLQAIKKGKIDVDTVINDYHQQILAVFREHPEMFW